MKYHIKSQAYKSTEKDMYGRGPKHASKYHRVSGYWNIVMTITMAPSNIEIHASAFCGEAKQTKPKTSAPPPNQ